MSSDLEPAQSVQPDRGGTVIALGALSLLTGACGLPLGIVPWIMASHDLKAMETGRMDSGGRRTIQAGKVFGIASVILSIPALLILGGRAATSMTISNAHVVETPAEDPVASGPVAYNWDGTQMHAVKGTLDSAGRATGEWCYWWPNGQIEAYGEFTNGEPRGPWLFWRADGLLWNGQPGEPVSDVQGEKTYCAFAGPVPYPNLPRGSGIYSAKGLDRSLTEEEVSLLRAKALNWIYSGVPSNR